MAVRESWTAPPGQPGRYRLRDRWSDFRNGRSDGRKDIPPVAPEESEGIPAREIVTPELDAAAGNPAEPAQTSVPITPYLHGLMNACAEALAAREKAWFDGVSPQFREKLRDAKTSREQSAIRMSKAKSRLDEVSRELTDEELNRRGVAEQDRQKWPDEMVRERRRRDQRLARAKAEDEMEEATVELRVAEVKLEHIGMAFDDALKSAQAGVRQIVHHYARREATYLRALARKHKQRSEILRLLQLTRPQLPEWLLQADAKKEEA